ncbi:Pimeloyl-ACP methyl ester carboxylesterase [Tenacibaculum sp. 190524A05c]|uniref:alpha/beta fold hydrolase n=1 Tax=Tenacibaculum platacis TaxID=3137852 RepID=UPI0031FB823D
MFKKILKIVSIILLVLLIGLYTLFTIFTAPKSDEAILKAYEKSNIQPSLTHEKYKNFSYRKISIQNDTVLPTMVFVHGTIGSLNDFSKYMADSLLQSKFNMIAYDRIGYNYEDKNSVQESIAFENEMLLDLIKELPKEKVVLVGYSYGGPIALSVKEKLKKIILLAPAVHSSVEPMPWMLNFYKWKITRWLVPKVWKQASKEKISHREDLKKFESNWNITPNKVVSIHGTSDWIVPYENSKMLQEQFDKEQFNLVDLDKGNHGLVWSNFDFIKEQLLKYAD